MDQSREIFCFIIDNQRYGVPLMSVERFMQAVTINAVPNSPPMVHGLIDYYGSLVPVINFRHRLKLPEKPVSASDYFVIVKTPKRKLAIVIDDVDDVINPSAKEIIPSSSLDSGLDNMGVLRQDQGIIFIYDLETLFSSKEEAMLLGLVDDPDNK